MGDYDIRIEGVDRVIGALDRMSRQIDVGTVAALKATQNLAKKSIRSRMRGRPRWNHRGKSTRTGAAVKVDGPAHVTRSGGPGKFTGTLQRGVGGVRKPKKTPEGYQGGVGVGGGAPGTVGSVRNLYKKRVEGQYPYVRPGVAKAAPKFPPVWEKAWGRATKT